MININHLKEDLPKWEAGMKRRGAKVDLKKIMGLLKEFNQFQIERDAMRAERNQIAKQHNVTAGQELKAKLAKLEEEMNSVYDQMEKLWLEVPNLPMDDVPDGGEDDAKPVGKPVGTPSKLANPKDHLELGKDLDLIDVERGAKVAGSRFYYLKNEAVQLEFALVRMVSDILAKKGFKFLMGPQLLSEKAMMAGGYLGKAAEEVYKTQDDLYLIGTSEQSMLAYHLDEIIEVPKRYASFSTCFRREAGSYGKDVKGIIRVHQFDKVEMFSYVAPEDAEKEHLALVEIEEEILKLLEIPYQKMLLAAGDLGMASAKTYDLESWMPSQQKYRETHSCSNCTDWQARRAMIRYRTPDGKTGFVHTLNGTAISLARFLAIFLENHQQKDGSINIPKALQPYCGFRKIG